MDIVGVFIIAGVVGFFAYHLGKHQAKLALSKNSNAIVWDEQLIKKEFVKYVFVPEHKVYICLSKDGILVLIDCRNGLITKLYHLKKDITDLVMIGGIAHIMLEQEDTATRLDKAELVETKWVLISAS